jgi:hypothetical protein
MNKEFFRTITSALRSAGWLMIGTALMIAVGSLTIGVSPEVTRWGYGSVVVGGCFVLIDVVISYLLRDKV